ncbi:biopolymer transport protein TolQ [Novosphingobium chloroacetimidivorans]|uniref:Biopolymer transport protein TolQ n=1 Tax=Novosphingobium chloroacetimidivorans TaxID=1428314 RepID=A0A7W7KB65_9SPHN|nr:protein TolQ [Novosphingobium chloroacetimidivorans]MBB4859571.1 biopolymer transport protein TolQ [Novosphingobium chloroacetimidivorans]
MTFDLLMAAAEAAAGAPTRLNPVKLFLDADIVVQVVMVGLILASVWTWTIIVSFLLRMGRVNRQCDGYERDFWEAENFDAFQRERRRGEVPIGKVAGAGLAEYKRNAAGHVDPEGARQRVALAMNSSVGEESDKLSNRLNFLATVGSVAPFVGLFGTVWGIMNSFFQIGQQQNSSLAVVAPGISEALFATAIGLFAAIPAVIAYNRFSHRVNGFEARLQRFADKLHAALTLQLEQR